MNNKTNIEKAIYRLKFHKEFAGMKNNTCIVNIEDIETVLTYIEQTENKVNKYDSLVNKIKKKFAKTQEEYELLLESQSGQESNRTKYLRGKIHTCQELLEKLKGE